MTEALTVGRHVGNSQRSAGRRQFSTCAREFSKRRLLRYRTIWRCHWDKDGVVDARFFSREGDSSFLLPTNGERHDCVDILKNCVGKFTAKAFPQGSHSSIKADEVGTNTLLPPWFPVPSPGGGPRNSPVSQQTQNGITTRKRTTAQGPRLWMQSGVCKQITTVILTVYVLEISQCPPLCRICRVGSAISLKIITLGRPDERQTTVPSNLAKESKVKMQSCRS